MTTIDGMVRSGSQLVPSLTWRFFLEGFFVYQAAATAWRSGRYGWLVPGPLRICERCPTFLGNTACVAFVALGMTRLANCCPVSSTHRFDPVVHLFLDA